MNLWIAHFWPWILAAISLAAAASVTVHAVLWKRDSRAVIGWVALAWLAPILGSFAYFCFGVNRIQRKALSLRLVDIRRRSRGPAPIPDDEQQREQVEHEHPNLMGLARLGYQLTGEEVLPGNGVEPLVNGEEAYPAMLRAIDEAQRSVALLSYIFDNDRAGEAFLAALVRAQQRGVEVRVLIDHVGSRYSRPTMVKRLQQAGLRVATFLPTRAPRLVQYANLRNHRKIMVADGSTGFTGGTNIREGHYVASPAGCPVQCLHFRITGPVVAQLQAAFVMDWAFASGESLQGEHWFPDLKRAGKVWARGIPDGPDEDFEKISDTLLGALAAATRRVRIVTPYFLPQSPLMHALNVTALRGVQVQILLPAKNNLSLVQWASTAQLWQLLQKGCQVYLNPPPFDHTKLMVVDGLWTLIGSSNWDPRSLRLNFEYNVECYNEALAAELEKLIEKKLAIAERLTLEAVNGRSLPVQLRDGLARLLTPYL